MAGFWGFPLERELRRALPLDFPEGVGCYVVADDELSPLLRRRRRVLAWTGSDLDVALRPHLESASRWIGRGFATVVNLARLESIDCADRYRDVVTMGLLLHEAAHYFGQYPHPTTSVDQKNQDRALLRVAAYAASLDTEAAVEREGHGPEFIRAGLHLVTRALSAGVPACSTLSMLDQYGWSPAAEYLQALDGETENRIDEPLRTVLADDPPAAFTHLAADDRRRFQLEAAA